MITMSLGNIFTMETI